VPLLRTYLWIQYTISVKEQASKLIFQNFLIIFRAGQLAGRQDGKALGIQKGFEIGHEIGFYAGCAQIWRQLGSKNQDFISARAEKAITALEELLHSFPLNSPRVRYFYIDLLRELVVHLFVMLTKQSESIKKATKIVKLF
jgi:hypothetical protein